MFGVSQREHEQRYDYAQEWLDAVKMAWGPEEDFDYDGKFIKLKKRARQAQALRRHAAADHERRRVADRPRLRHPQLRCLLHAGRPHLDGRDGADREVRQGRGQGAGQGARRLRGRRRHLPADRRRRRRSTTTTPPSRTPTGRRSTASSARRTSRRRRSARRSSRSSATTTRTGWAACSMVGDPDQIAKQLADLQQRRPARHRLLVRELPQGAAVLLRRGAAAARAHGHPREAEGGLGIGCHSGARVSASPESRANTGALGSGFRIALSARPE